jgi:oligosaccharyltransferase complex subunit alpha (ribophorin I)
MGADPLPSLSSQIDVHKQVVDVRTLLTLKNGGSAPAATAIVCEEPALAAHAAFWEVSGRGRGGAPRSMHHAACASSLRRVGGARRPRPVPRPQPPSRSLPPQVSAAGDGGATLKTALATPPGAPNGTACVSVTLEKALGAGETVEVESFAAHVRAQVPRPASISRGEPQRVALRYSHTLASPYDVLEQTTKVTLPDARVEAHSERPPTARDGKEITHGPYPAAAPWTLSPAMAHYVNNAPFVHVRERGGGGRRRTGTAANEKKRDPQPHSPPLVQATVAREIEVSHWGNVRVEEVYELEHAGAAVTGEWSRAAHDADPRGAWPSTLVGLRAILPAGARWTYFKDEIGNVSTSNVRVKPASVEALLRPRYPLIGGWRARCVFGHSLPLATVAERGAKAGRVKLVVPFAPSVGDIVADSLSVTLVLPEGAHKVRHYLPFQELEVSTGVKKTYLDTVGRPTLTLRLRNAVAEHSVPLIVTYSLPGWRPWVEPGMCVAAVAACFAAALVAARVDPALEPAGGKAGGALGAKLASLLDDRRRQIDALAAGASSGGARAAASASLAASAAKLTALLADLEGAGGGARVAAVRGVAATELAVQEAAAAVAAARAGDGARLPAAEGALAAARTAAAAAADGLAGAFG